ncbi:MAG: phosphoribosylformylglycinamidine synthase subunit PurQ [SAR324 cluster bacterium]|nr:phosphoribosylformylglycinamidine synthase subunit PurQ [SAR324 cluster bacterium]
MSKTLIFSGLGLNCERETAYACEISGAEQVDIVHLLDFLKGDTKLSDYDLVIFIGGFLDGDYLGSARVGVNRFKYAAEFDLKAELEAYVASGKLILGICNGFQFLVKLGLLPFDEDCMVSQSASLTQNSNGLFEDRWVNLVINSKNPSPFLKGIDSLYLPIRHGEGKIVVKDQKSQDLIHEQNLGALYYADKEGNSTAEYPANPNGSWENVAGLSNVAGNVFGLMPHPEAYNHVTNHPHWSRNPEENSEPLGLKIFKNAYQYLSQKA